MPKALMGLHLPEGLSEDTLCMADSCPAPCTQHGLVHAEKRVRTEERAWEMSVDADRKRNLLVMGKYENVLVCSSKERAHLPQNYLSYGVWYVWVIN